MAKVALFNDGEMVEVLTESNQSLDCLKTLCAKYPVNQGIVATVLCRWSTCTKLLKHWDTTVWLLW